MRGANFWRLLLTVIVVGWSVYNLIPWNDRSFESFIQSQVSAKDKDFSDLLTQANTQVQEGKYPSLFVALRQIANNQRIDLSQYFPQLNLADIKKLTERNDILLNHLLNASKGKVKLGLDLKGGVAFTLEVDDRAHGTEDAFMRERQLDKAVEILGSRINGLGVAEPIIRVTGQNKIEVQLPGVSSSENPDILAAIQKPAKLTFHRVNRDVFPATNNKKLPPLGYTLLEKEDVNPQSGELVKETLYVKQIPDLSGSMLKQATVGLTPYGGYQINLEFTPEGAERFKDITEQIAKGNEAPQYNKLPENNPSRYGRLAIVLDGQLYSAPRVMQAIPGGHAQITGNFTQREALDLANVLNNPLEFELKVDEMYEVGPSLAEDARASSIKSAIVGAGLVVVFMLIYYLAPGVIAILSVFTNILITLGILASLGATITMPGIAALVLTIGMAVDSNILILERIREELKAGKSNWAALQAGYDRAFSTILDANLTTLISTVILIFLGTGPVKGFGITLSIGVGATLFCALVVNRWMLELMVEKGWINRLVGVNLFKETHFDFMKFRKWAFIGAWIFVIAGFVVIGLKGKRIYGIDFLGGDEITLQFAEKPSSNDIYALAHQKQLGQVTLFYQKMLGDNKEYLKIQTELNKSDVVLKALNEAFPQAKFQLIGISHIGASVSKDIQYNALGAVGVALLFIMLYIAIRFEMGFGIGAMVSTIHDILMSIGIFVVLGGQFSAPMVAAILMIMGYSLNDTIVVFDRIREELKLNPSLSLLNIINLALNRTLSRTILTSFSTFLATLALYIFGAGEIKDFALMFMIGIVVGTFSSIFIASPVFFWWHKGNRRHVEERELLPKYNWDSSTKASK